MQEFISEDDLETFEGWLRYQGFDAATLAPDELADWRDMFDKGRKDSLATPKVGLMKLPRLPGEHRYAVAVPRGLRSLADVMGQAFQERRIFRNGAAQGPGLGCSH
jgi:hypothetical protein